MRIRQVLGTADGEWQCRFVADDKRCCQLSKDHYGAHQFAGDSAEVPTSLISAGDALADALFEAVAGKGDAREEQAKRVREGWLLAKRADIAADQREG